MKKEKSQKVLLSGIAMVVLFILWTVAISLIDVQPIGPQNSSVGFATLNGFIHSLTGVHMAIYTVTDWLGLIPLCFILGFALLGLIQLIKRKSLFKVDSSILVLGAFYIVVMAAYLFFEFYVVNYRPVLINGFLEASYPSSTTLLVMCVMPTAVMQLNSRIRNTKMKRAFAFALIAFTAFMVIGRLISGVHWITDIIGGAILSAGLVMIYYSVTTLITVIKNLIIFNDGVEKKLYSDRDNFADIYPFIPYQFNLLGSVLTSIRTHGASGKHLAEGERSMLALFKESAVKVMNDEPGTIVPFNMFYDALEQFLDHSHKGVISRALDNEYLNPNHDRECFDVNVLKTLFMIKYVKEIKANMKDTSMVKKTILSNAKTVRSHSRLDGLTFCDCISENRFGVPVYEVDSLVQSAYPLSEQSGLCRNSLHVQSAECHSRFQCIPKWCRPGAKPEKRRCLLHTPCDSLSYQRC